MITDFQKLCSFHWGNFFTECKISNNMATISGARHVKFGMQIDHKHQHTQMWQCETSWLHLLKYLSNKFFLKSKNNNNNNNNNCNRFVGLEFYATGKWVSSILNRILHLHKSTQVWRWVCNTVTGLETAASVYRCHILHLAIS
jgi:hypothetical protein